jgi:hypothetical protein
LKVQANINEFMNININKKIFYNLGAFGLFKKIDENHNKILMFWATHAIIYTRKTVNHLLNNLDILLPVDSDMQRKIEDKYTYKYPLCYQTHEVTENLIGWTNINNILDNTERMYNINLIKLNNSENIFLSDISKNTMKSLNLGEKNSDGYSLKIEKAEETNQNVILTLKEIKPENLVIIPDVYKYPFCLIKINSKKEIIFQ